MIQNNIVVCCYDKMWVNVAVYVIGGQVCVCGVCYVWCVVCGVCCVCGVCGVCGEWCVCVCFLINIYYNMFHYMVILHVPVFI